LKGKEGIIKEIQINSITGTKGWDKIIAEGTVLNSGSQGEIELFYVRITKWEISRM